MRIQSKLFLTIALASAVLVAVMYGLMQWSVDRGMLRYVNQREARKLEPTIARLALYYSENGSWAALSDPRTFDQLAGGRRSVEMRPLRGELRRGPRPPPPGDLAGKRSIDDPRSLTLLDADKNLIKGRLEGAEERAMLPVMVDDELVGWLVYGPQLEINEGFELQFLESLQETLMAISALVFLISALLSLLLARHFVRPIQLLARGTASLAAGDYDTRLAATRPDELGQLARDFNELAHTLAANQENRQRWFADISHELRTPLSILRGEIDALLDGVRPLDLGKIQSLADEVRQLERLVEDLYELSNADIGTLKYRKEPMNLSELLDSVLNQHRPALEKKNIVVSVQDQIGEKFVYWGDPVRLRQLLDNLIVNGLKYSERGGELKLELRKHRNHLLLTVDDSPPGVSDEQLEHLFEHLYRTDTSRNRATGGSGLGLTICKQIVEAHQGTIGASHSALGGIRITVSLPY